MPGRRKVADSGTQSRRKTHDKAVGQRKEVSPNNYFSSLLEHVLQAKLNHARTGGRRRNYAESIRRVFSHTWIRKLRVIQDVEEVRPKLQDVPLRDMGGLHE